jgi:hypothetical protein
LAAQRLAPLEVLFHEFAVQPRRGQTWKLNALGWATTALGGVLANGADRILVSTPAWTPSVRRFVPGCRPVWLPIPSTMGEEAPPETAAVRRTLTDDGRIPALVGHFGSYGGITTPGLTGCLRELLPLDAGFGVVLIGRGSDRYAAEFLAAHPGHAGRVTATGDGEARAVAAHIAACDVLVQPFPNGVTTRNTSTTVSLALGRPVVTTRGGLTESLWGAERAAVLVPPNDGRAMAEAVIDLLRDPARRARLGGRAAEAYRKWFALDVAVATPRQPPV